MVIICLPCMAMSNAFTFTVNILVVSDRTPDVVCSSLLASFAMSDGGNISICLGWAFSEPAWLMKSNPWGLFNSFCEGFLFGFSVVLVLLFAMEPPFHCLFIFYHDQISWGFFDCFHHGCHHVYIFYLIVFLPFLSIL